MDTVAGIGRVKSTVTLVIAVIVGTVLSACAGFVLARKWQPQPSANGRPPPSPQAISAGLSLLACCVPLLAYLQYTLVQRYEGFAVLSGVDTIGNVFRG